MKSRFLGIIALFIMSSLNLQASSNFVASPSFGRCGIIRLEANPTNQYPIFIQATKKADTTLDILNTYGSAILKPGQAITFKAGWAGNNAHFSFTPAYITGYNASNQPVLKPVTSPNAITFTTIHENIWCFAPEALQISNAPFYANDKLGQKIGIGAAALAITGIVGHMLYKKYKSGSENNENTAPANPLAAVEKDIITMQDSSNPEEIRSFAQGLDAYIKDRKILPEQRTKLSKQQLQLKNRAFALEAEHAKESIKTNAEADIQHLREQQESERQQREEQKRKRQAEAEAYQQEQELIAQQRAEDEARERQERSERAIQQIKQEAARLNAEERQLQEEEKQAQKESQRKKQEMARNLQTHIAATMEASARRQQEHQDEARATAQRSRDLRKVYEQEQRALLDRMDAIDLRNPIAAQQEMEEINTALEQLRQEYDASRL